MNQNAAEPDATPGGSTSTVRSRSGRGRLRRALSNRIGAAAPYLVALAVVLLLALLFLLQSIVVVINSGEAGVLYSMFGGGTQTDFVYSEGIHLIRPWDRVYIYDVRAQTVLHDFTVLTNKGLPIELKIAIRYHPEFQLLGLLHKEVGPDYIYTIIIPQIESVMRRYIGKYEPEDIYTNKEGILADIIARAVDEAGRKYVFIDDLIIRSVQLPEDVKKAIDDKLVHKERWESYEFRLSEEEQEAKRKHIEAEGIRDYQSTVAQTLSDKMLKWQAIEATKKLAESNNAKVVVIGAGKDGLPIILGNQ